MNFSLSLIEVLAFAGLFQCVSILVYLFFRAGRFALAFVPILFFMDLTVALYFDFGSAFFQIEDFYLAKVRFWLWMMICPLSILFILQFSNLEKPLSIYSYIALLPLLLASLISNGLMPDADPQMMYIFGAVGATLSLPFLWFKKGLLLNVKSETYGQERFWMILSLIVLAIMLISLTYTFLADHVVYEEYTSIRTVLGLLFVYLSATYLFRVYPPPIRALTKTYAQGELSAEEEKLLDKIKNKLEYEKVYLEPSYSRSDMARELEVSESLLSRLMNQNYQENFPSILNRYRVEEARQLLEETDAAINVIAEEVGFNSLATFNRVFKDQTNETASKYRQKKVKEASRKIA